MASSGGVGLFPSAQHHLRFLSELRQQLRDQLDPTDWDAINRYLSLAATSPSDFDRFLETVGYRLKPPLPAQQPERLTGVTALTDSQTADVLSRFLESHSHLVSNAGMRLSTLINDDEPDPSHIEVAADLWQALLASQAADSTQGFGSLPGVTALDTDRWARLTLTTIARTGGRIDWADRVANRAVSQPPTTTTLEILNQLIRGQLEPWDLR